MANWGKYLTIPFREIDKFKVATVNSHCYLFQQINAGNALDGHWDYGFIGREQLPGASYWGWFTLIYPNDSTFTELPGADSVFSWGLYVEFYGIINTCDIEDIFYVAPYQMSDPWDHGGEVYFPKVTTKKYDGVNEWEDYPINYRGYTTGILRPEDPEETWCVTTDRTACPVYSELPTEVMVWSFQHHTAGGCLLPCLQEDFFKNPIVFNSPSVWDGEAFVSPGANEKFQVGIIPKKLKVLYWNPVPTHCSHSYINPNNVPDFEIYGLGFKIPNQDVWDHRWSDYDVWNDRTWKVQFIGLQGQGTFEVENVAPLFNTMIVTNTKVTIPAGNMPALPQGTYYIKLIKDSLLTPGSFDYPTGYVGDWELDSAGRMTEGVRFALLVGPYIPTEPPGPIYKTKWAFKDPLGNLIFKYYAPIDIITTDVFWDGRILDISDFTIQIDDRTGLYSVADMTVTLANHDKEFSKLMAQYFLKNQWVQIFVSFHQDPDNWKTKLMALVVDDHWFEGPLFKVKLKDLTNKYFKMKIPQRMITIDDYPNAHESAISLRMPDALGLNELQEDPPGAIEALYVDTTAWKYLALGSSGNITAVYSDGNLRVEGAGNDYTITFEGGGITYINFNADQENNKITFDCEGYSYPDWNSPNGYIQNPVYIIAFFLSFIMQLPLNFLDIVAWDELAQEFEDHGMGEAGRLTIQNESSAETILLDLLFSYKVKLWLTKEGKLRMGRKDLTEEIDTDLIFFRQIDANDVVKRDNLGQAINQINSKLDFYPTANFYKDSWKDGNVKAQEDHESVMESGSAILFPWTTSKLLVKRNVSEILDQMAYGDKKIEFNIPMQKLDLIDIFDTFKFQDPFGLSLTGEGEIYRFYYCVKLSYKLKSNEIAVEGVDLQYLLAQCFILGDHASLADIWADASPEERIFGFLCSNVTNKFPDGIEGKHLCRMR